MGIYITKPRVVKQFHHEVRIAAIDSRGYFITDTNGGIRYLHSDGEIRSTVNNRRTYAFWPTREAALEFYNKWRIDK